MPIEDQTCDGPVVKTSRAKRASSAKAKKRIVRNVDPPKFSEQRVHAGLNRHNGKRAEQVVTDGKKRIKQLQNYQRKTYRRSCLCIIVSAMSSAAQAVISPKQSQHIWHYLAMGGCCCCCSSTRNGTTLMFPLDFGC